MQIEFNKSRNVQHRNDHMLLYVYFLFSFSAAILKWHTFKNKYEVNKLKQIHSLVAVFRYILESEFDTVNDKIKHQRRYNKNVDPVLSKTKSLHSYIHWIFDYQMSTVGKKKRFVSKIEK